MGDDECVPLLCDTGTAPGVAAGGKTAGGLRSRKSNPLIAVDDDEADGALGGGLRLLPCLEGAEVLGPWYRCEPTPGGFRESLLPWLCSEETEEEVESRDRRRSGWCLEEVEGFRECCGVVGSAEEDLREEGSRPYRSSICSSAYRKASPEDSTGTLSTSSRDGYMGS